MIHHTKFFRDILENWILNLGIGSKNRPHSIFLDPNPQHILLSGDVKRRDKKRNYNTVQKSKLICLRLGRTEYL